MGGRIRRYLCSFVFAAIVFCSVQYKVCAEEGEALVTTSEAFMDALRQNKSTITVSGEITVDNGAETDGRMRPPAYGSYNHAASHTFHGMCF